jgi:hypothetical protein
MFTIVWDDPAFDQMHALILWNPERRGVLSRALQSLSQELSQRADEWGESREGDARLGFIGDLSVLIRVDLEDRVVRLIEVALRPGEEPG